MTLKEWKEFLFDRCDHAVCGNLHRAPDSPFYTWGKHIQS